MGGLPPLEMRQAIDDKHGIAIIDRVDLYVWSTIPPVNTERLTALL